MVGIGSLISEIGERPSAAPFFTYVAGRHIFRYMKFMSAAATRTRKPRGRGRPSTRAQSIHLRLLPDQLAGLKDWIATQPKPRPSRPEAIRRLIDLGLIGTQPMRQRSSKAASKAVDLAGEQIDKLSDPSASAEEQQQRKRRLLKGPKEFRDIRGDFPKSKS
jgi:hypothetical protein